MQGFTGIDYAILVAYLVGVTSLARDVHERLPEHVKVLVRYSVADLS